MPSTYTPIATATVSGSSTNSITFSSISGTYTDIFLVGNWSGNDFIAFRFNGDTGTNYSMTSLYGTGSVAGSYRNSNQDKIDNNITSTNFSGNIEMSIMNYSNTTTNKTSIFRFNDATVTGSRGSVALWRNTSAITSITVLGFGTVINFTAGSTFTLYGIKAA
jgi:hypothetical protein